jgi:hypothetical protein
MRSTVMLLVASACLCAGCKTALLPDPTVAHKLSRDETVEVWIRRPDGKLEKQKMRFVAGDFCATANAVGTAGGR